MENSQNFISHEVEDLTDTRIRIYLWFWGKRKSLGCLQSLMNHVCIQVDGATTVVTTAQGNGWELWRKFPFNIQTESWFHSWTRWVGPRGALH